MQNIFNLLRKYFTFVVFIVPTLSSIGQDSTIVNKLVQHYTIRHNFYSLKQFAGKWQEALRTDRKNDSAIAFKDTMFLIFSGYNDVSTRDGVNMSLKGKAILQPGNVLEAAADVFVIKSLNDNETVLDDREKYIHKFIKKKTFWYERLPTDTISPDKFTAPLKVNFSAIRGKWMVYKRDAKPGTVFNDERLVKILNIAEMKSDDTFNGAIVFYRSESTSTEDCVITLDGETMYIVTEKHAWHMDIYKADGKEFIFGDPTLMYYCKPITEE